MSVASARRLIRCVAPRVSQAQAIEALRRGAVASVLAQPLRSLAMVYVPFGVYEVHIRNRGRTTTSILGADAVSGLLDPYEFEHVPDRELMSFEAANVLPARLPVERSIELLEGKVRRAVFQSGFFRVSALCVAARRLPVEVHVPFWLAFYGRHERVRLRVMDAVRRQVEGAKARALFQDWLLNPG